MKFEEAADRFRRYLDVYGRDFSAYVMAIKALIELNRPDELRDMCLRARTLENYDMLSQRFPEWARFIDNKVASEGFVQEAAKESTATEAEDTPLPE
jgi:hypothetical protein